MSTHRLCSCSCFVNAAFCTHISHAYFHFLTQIFQPLKRFFAWYNFIARLFWLGNCVADLFYNTTFSTQRLCYWFHFITQICCISGIPISLLTSLPTSLCLTGIPLFSFDHYFHFLSVCVCSFIVDPLRTSMSRYFFYLWDNIWGTFCLFFIGDLFGRFDSIGGAYELCCFEEDQNW